MNKIQYLKTLGVHVNRELEHKFSEVFNENFYSLVINHTG